MAFKIPFFERKDKSTNIETKGADYKTYLLYNNSYQFLDYNNSKLALEGFIKNIIVYRCITAKTLQFKKLKYVLYQSNNSGKAKKEIETHEILKLLNRPYPGISKANFLERIGTQFDIYGEAYIQKIYKNNNGSFQKSKPVHLFAIRPDEINNIPGKNHFNAVYQYTPEYGDPIDFRVTVLGESNLMIMRKYNPQNDFHGLSPIVPAGYSIDTHNEYAEMSYNLASNGAQPTGILTVPADRKLTDEEFTRIKKEMNAQTGASEAGKPKLLEGGLTWQQITIDPDKMSSNETLTKQAHNIALAFGVPMELLNQEQGKFENKAAAYEQLYEEAILPMSEDYIDLLNAELVPLYGDNLRLGFSYDHTMVMGHKQIRKMKDLKDIEFLTDNEKRDMVGYESHPEGESLAKKTQAKPQTEDLKESFVEDETKNGASVKEAFELYKEIHGQI